jgi:hypothetical protein
MPYLPPPLLQAKYGQKPQAFHRPGHIHAYIHRPALHALHIGTANNGREYKQQYTRAFARLGLYEKVRLLIGHRALLNFFSVLGIVNK